MRFALIVALGLAFGPVTAQAQDAQTLADVRQELTVLNVEVQKLRRELSTTGGASVAVTGGSVLERVNAMESELQRLTSKTEELENRINRVVTDGTNRIGDLEFRLVELEGGDVGSLGQTSTLGGGEKPATMAPATPLPAPPQSLQWVKKQTSSGRRRRSLTVTFAAPQTSLRPSIRPIRADR